MGNNVKDAVALLVEAGDVIGKKRPGVHGHTENSFQMIGDMWSAYLSHTMAVRANKDYRILPQDVARMMELLKIARSIYGDQSNRDNYIDSIGYAALAGMLQLPSAVPAKVPNGTAADREFEEKVLKAVQE